MIMERARVYFSMRIANNLERMRVRRFSSSVPKNKKRLGYRSNRHRGHGRQRFDLLHKRTPSPLKTYDIVFAQALHDNISQHMDRLLINHRWTASKLPPTSSSLHGPLT